MLVMARFFRVCFKKQKNLYSKIVVLCMHKAKFVSLFFLLLILAVSFVNAAASEHTKSAFFSPAADNSIISVDANYDGNKTLVVSYLCVKTDSDSVLTILDSNGTTLKIQNLALDCTSSLQQTSLVLNNLLPKRTVFVKLEIKSPCAVCSRSSFVFISPFTSPSTVPDYSPLLVIIVLVVVVAVVKRKTI